MATPDPVTGSRRNARLPAYERRVVGGSLLVALPSMLGLLGVLAYGRPDAATLGFLLVAVVLATLWLARWHCRRLIYPIQTLASLLDALREGDYTLRGTSRHVLGDLIYDINALAEQLQRERLRFEESSYLLGKTLAALDNAVLVFDQEQRLRLLNPAAQQLLRSEQQDLFGRSASELGLQVLLDGRSGQLLSHVFPGRQGRFEICHMPMRRGGQRGMLLVINDVGRVLREEERQAWQRLLRVLGHEVNNSLAPIQSMAGTLISLLQRESLPEDWQEDFHVGLDVIAHRAGALSRFFASYSRLARLPVPCVSTLALGELLAKVARLDRRVPVHLDAGEPVWVEADPDQLEQALINLIRNAVDASLSVDGEVRVCWSVRDAKATVEICDDGPGPPISENLFVPFFTTKPGGSGIGLALARQIAEAHGGGVSLDARSDGPGAVAQLWLPLNVS